MSGPWYNGIDRLKSRIRTRTLSPFNRPDATDDKSRRKRVYADFLDHVGSIISDFDQDDIVQLWETARTEAWSGAVKRFREDPSASCAACAGHALLPTTPRPTTSLSHYSSQERAHSSLSHRSSDAQTFRSYEGNVPSSAASEQGYAPSFAIRKGSIFESTNGHFDGVAKRTLINFNSSHTVHDSSAFPYVSHVPTATVVVVLHLVHSIPELGFTPLKPSKSSNDVEYLENHASHSVIHVRSHQFEQDTGGRKWTDAVYKRVKPAAPNEVWLQFLKELVVSHHMSFNAPKSHRSHVIQLLSVGWDYGLDDALTPTPTPVLALESAHYGSLKSLFYPSSPVTLTYDSKKEILLDIAEGLVALHNSGIVHGDLKPENIKLCKHSNERGMIAKLTGFGNAVVDLNYGPDMQTLSDGTFPYTAPECIGPMARNKLRYTDVYSFGVVVWQTFLHGRMPFFSGRYHHGEPLDEDEVQMLKTGNHSKLASLYNIDLHETDGPHRTSATSEPQEVSLDPTNELLVAMARESFIGMDESFIPKAEMPEILTLLQMALSSDPQHRRLDACRLILGGALPEDQMIAILNWESLIHTSLFRPLLFHTETSRFRYMLSQKFEQYFMSLSYQPAYHDFSSLTRLDQIFASRLGAALLEHYSREYLAGDSSNNTVHGILNTLRIVSAAGDLSSAAAALGIYQHVNHQIEYDEIFTIGAALAILRGDNALARYARISSSQKLLTELSKKQNYRCFKDMTSQQANLFNRIQPNVQLGFTEINCACREGNTLLHWACKLGDHTSAMRLLKQAGSTACVRNMHGEQPIHFLHQFSGPNMEKIAIALVKGGGDMDCAAKSWVPECEDGPPNPSSLSGFETPLLRSIVRGNIAAVQTLVKLGAKISKEPLIVAAYLLESEILDILLTARTSTTTGEDVEALEVWEETLTSMTATDRLKFQGAYYRSRIKSTFAVLTKHMGGCFTLLGTRSALEQVVATADLNWIAVILEGLYANPRGAVLAELQKGLLRAAALGRHHIFSKFMDYGALPLLPEKWGNSHFVAGVPWKWSAQQVGELVEDRATTASETRCALHVCAEAGRNSYEIARCIVENPVRNPCLMPDLGSEGGAPHFVTRMLEGRSFIGLNRRDEGGRTALCCAVKRGELDLAKYLVSKGATKDSHERYIHGSPVLFEVLQDRKEYLPMQLEFLLNSSAGLLPAFRLEKMTAEQDLTLCSSPTSPLYPGILSVTRGNVITVITAAAHACASLDTTSKRRVWDAILGVFHQPAQILAKAGNTNALQIAISNGDEVTLECLVNELARKSFIFGADTSLVDQIRDKLLGEAPTRVVTSKTRDRIVRYRCSLGHMITIMLNAGDLGHAEREDVAEQILSRTEREYPVLIHGFQQRGESLQAINQFKEDTEEFLSAFLTTLYSIRNQKRWLEAIQRLEDGFEKLLAPYFTVDIIGGGNHPSATAAKRTVRLRLNIITDFKKILLDQASTGSMPVSPVSESSSINTNTDSVLSPAQLNLFNKLIPVSAPLRTSYASSTIKFAADEILEFSSLGYIPQGATDFALPTPEQYLASLLILNNPVRTVRDDAAANGANGAGSGAGDATRSHAFGVFQNQIQEVMGRREGAGAAATPAGAGPLAPTSRLKKLTLKTGTQDTTQQSMARRIADLMHPAPPSPTD